MERMLETIALLENLSKLLGSGKSVLLGNAPLSAGYFACNPT
jgi:hypothetical protein